MPTQETAVQNANVQNASVQSKWSTRDFVTLAIFNVIMLIVTTILTMLITVILTPVGSYLIGAGVIALVNGPFYMAMANKVGKRGVLFFSSLLGGLYFLVMGYLPIFITMLVTGVVCELIMSGRAAYRSTGRNIAGYSAYYIGYTLAAILPLVLFKNQYLDKLKSTMTQEQVDQYVHYYNTPGPVMIMLVVSLLGAISGCWVGSLFLKRHAKKAKLL